MKSIKLIAVVYFAVSFFFSVPKASAQEAESPNGDRQTNEIRRPNLLSELELSPEQIGEIRRLNRAHKSAAQTAQQNLRLAKQTLDEAIYADNFDEANFRLRVKQLQNAQTEIIKLRSASELAVRRVLTGAQLARFRELRRNFIENKEPRPNRGRGGLRNLPNRRFDNRRLPPND